MSRQHLQDIYFTFKEPSYDNYSSTHCTTSLLYNYLIQQFRNNKLFKKQYSENFNLIHTLKHKDISGPYDVKTNQKFIFIASLSLSHVSVFKRLTREHISNIEISGGSCTTIGLDPNNENDVYIAGLNQNLIYFYKYNVKTAKFEFVKKFSGTFHWITNFVIDKNLIYCVERNQSKISILNKQNGQIIKEIKNEHIIEPWSIALFNNDYFFSTSLKLKSISKFSLLGGGTLIKSFKEIDGAAGIIINDKTNHLLVCSYGMKKVFIFDCNSLELIKEVVDCNFTGIISIDIDCDGNLYISENHANEIKIFN